MVDIRPISQGDTWQNPEKMSDLLLREMTEIVDDYDFRMKARARMVEKIERMERKLQLTRPEYRADLIEEIDVTKGKLQEQMEYIKILRGRYGNRLADLGSFCLNSGPESAIKVCDMIIDKIRTWEDTLEVYDVEMARMATNEVFLLDKVREMHKIRNEDPRKYLPPAEIFECEAKAEDECADLAASDSGISNEESSAISRIAREAFGQNYSESMKELRRMGITLSYDACVDEFVNDCVGDRWDAHLRNYDFELVEAIPDFHEISGVVFEEGGAPIVPEEYLPEGYRYDWG